MNLDKVEEEEEDSELPGISRNEALSDNESDNDFRNLSFEMPFTSLKEALPDDDKRPGSASLKDAALDSDKKKRKSKGKEKSTESSSRRSTVSYNLKDFARASTPDAALPPPMGAPPPPGPPLPPDLSRRGPPPPPPPPAQEVRNVATLPSLKFNAKDLKFSKKRLRNAKEILKMGRYFLSSYFI